MAEGPRETTQPAFIYVPDDDRLQQAADDFGKVTDVLRADTVQAARQVALVSWTGRHLDACAVMTRSGRVASYKTRVRLTDFFDGISVDLYELVQLIPDPSRGRVEAALRGGQLDVESAAALRRALIAHEPDAAQAWTEAEAKALRDPPELWPDDGVPVVAYERDATGLALWIAGIPRADPLSSWDGDTEAPFLQGVPAFRVYEQAALTHDSAVFGKWTWLGPSLIGVARFRDGQRRLEIVYANETPIEHTLGCDLVYYVHGYDAYILVQYKRLQRAAVGWEFRPDANLDGELARMRDIATGADETPTPESYRMGENFCFIKFCQPVSEDPFGAELSPGMYLPLDYFDRLVEANRLIGRRGGTVLTYENADRWLNNTAFVALVERAWLGAHGLTSRHLKDIVRRSLTAGHSALIATGYAPRPRRRPR